MLSMAAAQPYEESFQVVIAGFVNLAALDANVINRQFLLIHQFIEIETKRTDILREFCGSFFEGHEDTRLVVLNGAANQELHGEQGLARASAAADEGWPTEGQTTSGDFIEALDASGCFWKTAGSCGLFLIGLAHSVSVARLSRYRLPRVCPQKTKHHS